MLFKIWVQVFEFRVWQWKSRCNFIPALLGIWTPRILSRRKVFFGCLLPPSHVPFASCSVWELGGIETAFVSLDKIKIHYICYFGPLEVSTLKFCLRPQVIKVEHRMTEYFEFFKIVILDRIIGRFIEDEVFLASACIRSQVRPDEALKARPQNQRGVYTYTPSPGT